MAEVIQLDAHENMTPQEALAVAARRNWQSVLVCGFVPETGDLVVVNSAMSREWCLWIAEHLRMHAIGIALCPEDHP